MISVLIESDVGLLEAYGPVYSVANWFFVILGEEFLFGGYF